MVLFTAAMERRLTELYEERKSRIEVKGNKQSLNADRKRAWQEMADILNAENGVQLESALNWEQVKKKWSNLKMNAKEANAAAKKGRKITGGGPKETPDLTETQQAVINIAGNSSRFDGEDEYVESPLGIKKQDVEECGGGGDVLPKNLAQSGSLLFSPNSSATLKRPRTEAAKADADLKSLQKEVLEKQLKLLDKQIENQELLKPLLQHTSNLLSKVEENPALFIYGAAQLVAAGSGNGGESGDEGNGQASGPRVIVQSNSQYWS